MTRSARAGRGRHRAVVAAATVALLLAGCSSGSSGSSGPGTTSLAVGSGAGDSDLVAPQGFTTVTMVVTRPDGTTEEWCLWLADTSALRAQGLMHVTDPELGGADGMVFAFPDDTTAAFWMRNTPLSLSIAWYGGDGAFVDRADMEPCPADTPDAACPRYGPSGPYRYAIETPTGALDALGLVAGSTVELGGTCSLAA